MMFLNIVRVLIAGWCFNFAMINFTRLVSREELPLANFLHVTIPAVLLAITFVVW